MISCRFLSVSVSCIISVLTVVDQVSTSLNDSSSVVAGDESKLVPVWGRPGVIVVDEMMESSWLASVGDAISSLQKNSWIILIVNRKITLTHSYKLGSDLGRLVRLRFGEHSLYDSLRAFGCDVFCFPLLSDGVWSPPPSNPWCPCGEPDKMPDEPPVELVIVLFELWWKSVWDESGCDWSCEVLLDAWAGRWNCVSPLGRALNDADRSVKTIKSLFLQFTVVAIYWIDWVNFN